MATQTMASEATLSERDFRRVSDVVYKYCGINLHDGKKELVRARLAKRLRECAQSSFTEYLDAVLADTTSLEFTMLVDSLSTNLTSFFREHQHFDFLSHTFLPELVARKRSQNVTRIRAWSAGCSSGEEPYTLAITLREALEGQGVWDAKILASDISTRMLQRAKAGAYDHGRIASVQPRLRSKYFQTLRQNNVNYYQVMPTLREMVVFHHINLMGAWPFQGQMDFIFCRNVMIYFDKQTQQQLIGRFHKALAHGGILFTGHSESLTGIDHALKYVQPTVYRKA